MDKIKIDAIKHYGYEVLIVWESEFNNDPKTVIDKCIKFINN